jgi:hypothetical protein
LFVLACLFNICIAIIMNSYEMLSVLHEYTN